MFHQYGRIKSAFWLYCSARVLKTASYLSWRTVWGKVFFSENNSFDDAFGHWLEKIWSTVEQFSRGSPNWFLREHRYILRRNPFGEIITFHHFWILGENVSTFRREDFGCDQQNWILFNHSNNCNKFVFFVIFGQWLNSTCPQEHFEEKKSFSRKKFNFSLSFSDNERTLLALWQTFWTWLSELLSTCPWEHFEEIYFIEQEIVVHLSFLDTKRKFINLLAKNFRLSVRLFSKELYDFHSTCPEIHLGEFFFSKFFFGHWGHFLNMVVRTASDASIITLWGKLFY